MCGGLLPTILLVSVKPLANVVCDYARQDGSKKFREKQ